MTLYSSQIVEDETMAHVKIQSTTVTAVGETSSRVVILIADNADKEAAIEAVSPEFPFLGELQLSALHRAREIIGEHTEELAPKVRSAR